MNKQRSTRQRAAIRTALEHASGFRSAQQLFDELRAGGDSVGLTTVYRTLQGLAEAGDVDVIQTGDGEALYRICGTDDHHHHLVCRSCRHSVEVDSAAVERWAAGVADRHGFTAPSHVVEVFGLCKECSN
ncbi:MAG: Fur family transcriptional regulator [Actinomycetota bacterium]